MQVNVESTGALTRQLRVEIPVEEYEREYQQRICQVASRAKIPGFRPGKAPLTVIQRQYGESARADAISELMRRTFPDAIHQAGVSPAGMPRFELEAEPPAKPLTYVAHFDVYPEIQLKALDSLKIEQPTVTVTDADVDRLIENLRKARRQWRPAGRPAQTGDQCKVDFDGKINGEPFPGGKGENVELELGAGQFLPDLENAIVGHAVGDHFTASVNFPEDYQNETLRGKAAEFDVALKEVNAAELPPIDGEFLKAHGLAEDAGESGLRDKGRSALESERDKAVRNRIREALFRQLLDANPIEVPPSRVQQEIERMRNDAFRQTGLEKMGRKLEAEQIKQLLPDQMFEQRAQQRVGLGLLVAELVRENKIEVDEARVKTTLEGLAKDYENPDELIRYYLSNAEIMNGLRNSVLEEQVVDFLLERAQKETVALSLEDLRKAANQQTSAG